MCVSNSPATLLPSLVHVSTAIIICLIIMFHCRPLSLSNSFLVDFDEWKGSQQTLSFLKQ